MILSNLIIIELVNIDDNFGDVLPVSKEYIAKYNIYDDFEIKILESVSTSIFKITNLLI